jgi:hypothetical protein
MSTIKSSTTLTTAYSVEADTTGALVIQTGAAPTTAVTVAADQSVTFAQAANLPNTFGFKNRIINGAMVIDQRNAGASSTPSVNGTYLVDRWQIGFSAGLASKFTVGQNLNSVTLPNGFSNYFGIQVATAATPSSTDNSYFAQPIEANNMSDMDWGTANAKSVTLSFQVYSSLTGTFSGSLFGYSSGRSYPFTFSIASANTWTSISVTVVGDTSGTWAISNSGFLYVLFNLGSGSSNLGTANAWSATQYFGATGSVQLVSNASATFYITGVQLEKGSTATSFDYRPYGTELALCQRYLPAFVSTSTVDSIGGGSSVASTTTGNIILPFKTSARTAPTGVTVSAASNINIYTTRSGTKVLTAVTFGGLGESTESCSLGFSVASGLTAHDTGLWFFNSASGKILFTGCEL